MILYMNQHSIHILKTPTNKMSGRQQSQESCTYPSATQNNWITHPIRAIRDFSESVKEFAPGILACSSHTNFGRQYSDI